MAITLRFASADSCLVALAFTTCVSTWSHVCVQAALVTCFWAMAQLAASCGHAVQRVVPSAVWPELASAGTRAAASLLLAFPPGQGCRCAGGIVLATPRHG